MVFRRAAEKAHRAASYVLDYTNKSYGKVEMFIFYNRANDDKHAGDASARLTNDAMSGQINYLTRVRACCRFLKCTTKKKKNTLARTKRMYVYGDGETIIKAL